MRPRTTIALIAVLAWTLPAAAQPSGDVAAEAVFEQGLRKFEAGNFAEACPLLARAVELSTTEALGGTLTLAECYEKIDRPATAWGLYKRVAARGLVTGQKDRADAAQRAADRLEPTLPRVDLRAGSSAPAGLRVRVGKETIPADVWAVPLPVDPGSTSFTFEADGLAPRTITIEIPKGPSSTEVVAPDLSGARAPADSTPSPNGAEPAAGSLLGAIGITGIVTGAVGLATLGASLGVMVDAKSRHDDAIAADCAGQLDRCSTLAGLDEARAQGDVGGALFGVGIGLAAAGVGLVILDAALGPTSPTKESASIGLVVAPGLAYASWQWRL